jgi:hypothetical protein
MTAATYRLPDALGAADVTITGRRGPLANVTLVNVMPGLALEIPFGALVDLAPLPVEPTHPHSLVHIGSGQCVRVFRRTLADRAERWAEQGTEEDWLTWPDVCKLGDPVTLIAEPTLRQLEALAVAAKAWVASIKDPIGVWGDDTDQALLDAAVALGATYDPVREQ